MYLRILRFPIVLYAILFAFVGVPNVAGQQWTVSTDDEWCDDDDWDEKYCEVREITLKADRDVIIVDGDKNGGIRVEGDSGSSESVRMEPQQKGGARACLRHRYSDKWPDNSRRRSVTTQKAGMVRQLPAHGP